MHKNNKRFPRPVDKETCRKHAKKPGKKPEYMWRICDNRKQEISWSYTCLWLLLSW